MFGDNLKDQFSKDLLDAASKILKKEPTKEETKSPEAPAEEDMIGQQDEEIQKLNEEGIADLHKSMAVGETKDLGNGRYAHKFGMKLGKMRNGPVIVALHQLAHDTGCGMHREEVASNLTTRLHHVTITGHRHKVQGFLDKLGGSAVKEGVEIQEGRPLYGRRRTYATNVKPFHETEAGKKALADIDALAAKHKAQREKNAADPDYFKKRLDAARAHKEEVEGWGGNVEYFIESGTRIYPMFDKARSTATNKFADSMVRKHRDGNFSKYGQHSHFSSMAFYANAALDQHSGQDKQRNYVRKMMGHETSGQTPAGIPIHDAHIDSAIEHMKKARTEYTLGKMKKEEFQGDLEIPEEEIERMLLEVLEDLAEATRGTLHPWYEHTDKGHEFGYIENGKRIRTGLMGAHPAVDRVITRMIHSHVETINAMNSNRKNQKEEVDLTEILGWFKKDREPNPKS